MSGTKRITVDRQAWQDLLAKAARLRDVQRDLPDMLAAVREAQRQQAEHDTAELNARQDELTRKLAALSQQARQLEASATRRIRAAAEQMLSQAREQQSLQEERFANELARERAEREQEAAALGAELAGVLGEREVALSAAAAVVADARLLHDAIAGGLPHERFAPGRLAACEKRLLLAEANVAQGLGEAALAQVQDLYLRLGELRAEVELRDAQWRAAHLAAVAAVTALTGRIRYNAVIELTDEDRTFPLDVDFWSGGDLAAITADADALAARVSDEADPPTAAELHLMAEREVAELDERLTRAASKARTRQWASQIRVNLAEMVVGILEESTGYCWEGEATYAGDDQRAAFYSKLRHSDASEIVVEVSPGDDGEECVLRIHTYDAGLPDESGRALRAQAIADSLREQGLPGGAPVADAAPPDPALADFERLRQTVRAVPG